MRYIAYAKFTTDRHHHTTLVWGSHVSTIKWCSLAHPITKFCKWKLHFQLPYLQLLHKLVECRTLWGESERVHMQNMEQITIIRMW